MKVYFTTSTVSFCDKMWVRKYQKLNVVNGSPPEKLLGWALNCIPSNTSLSTCWRMYKTLFLLSEHCCCYCLYLSVSLKPHAIVGGTFGRWLVYRGFIAGLLLGGRALVGRTGSLGVTQKVHLSWLLPWSALLPGCLDVRSFSFARTLCHAVLPWN